MVLWLAGLAACGGDSEPEPADLVEASLLRVSDLPQDQEWAVTDEETDPGLDAFDDDADACERRHDPTADSAEAEQESDTFTGGELDSVSSTGWVVRDEAKRDAFFDSLDDQFACVGRVLSKYLRSQLPAGVSVEVATPYELDVETTADRTAGRALQVGVAYPGEEVARLTVFIDVLAVEEGELLAGYLFFHAGGLTLEEEADAVDRAVDRVKDQRDAR